MAVAAIFLLVPRLGRVLEGYAMPGWLREAVAVSAACGLATAPVMWVQFHAVSLLTIPANAAAAPAMVPLLALAFAAAAIAPFAPPVASAMAWLNGWLAAYIATCARIVGGLPGAQIRSTRAMLVLVALLILSTTTGIYDQHINVHDRIGKLAQVYGAYVWAFLLLLAGVFAVTARRVAVASASG